MLVHKIFAPIRKVLPTWLSRRVRSVFMGLLTPIFFSYETGHFLSSLKNKSVTKRGEPLPWYTYPAVHFLETKDFKKRTVLEFGAGQSTLWWSMRATSVLSFEADPSWQVYVERHAQPNVKLIHTPQDLAGIESHLRDQWFDIIVVDGMDRVKASSIARDVVKPSGAIIVDNTDEYWEADGTRPIMDLFRSAGFFRLDFYGHHPASIVPGCTSIFFQHDCFLLEGCENPVRRVEGAGKSELAFPARRWDKSRHYASTPSPDRRYSFA